jgi:hypothetical protein
MEECRGIEKKKIEIKSTFRFLRKATEQAPIRMGQRRKRKQRGRQKKKAIDSEYKFKWITMRRHT